MSEPKLWPCAACGRKITFAKNETTGRLVPLERVRRVYRFELASYSFEVLAVSTIKGPLWVSHFETCG